MEVLNRFYLAKRSYLYLCIGLCASTSVFADFIEDSKTSIYLRNFYIERDFSNVPNKSIGSWSQAVSGRFESGYTDTPLQVGLNLNTQYALRLGSRNAERLDTIFQYDSAAQKQERDYLKLGATLKLKYKASELQVGELYPRLPVAYIDDSRQLVTTYAGALFENKSIDNLKFTAGRITHINARDNDRFQKLSLFAPGAPRYESDGLNFVGLDYQFNPAITGAYWYGQLQDIYQQHYVNAAYNTQIGKNKMKLDARYFNNSEVGDAYYGKIDSQTFGLQGSLQNGPHMMNVGVQKNSGQNNFPTLAGYAPQPFLHTWSTLGFIKPEELTWHAMYSHDFKPYGLDGLRMTLRYLHGSGIERPGFEDNKETETNYIISYVVPEGSLKGLGLEWRHIRTDTKYGAGYQPGADFVENRIITTYTYQF